MDIRLLKANEIEVRVGSVKGDGMSLLLYKDARCDMKILDEMFGWDGWKREHTLIDGKLFCTVSVWSERLGEWITKQDVGTESNAEKEKGQASDSFKRACFNLGIGRELYTSPFIWVKGYGKYDKFTVSEIGYNEDREIDHLVILDKDKKEAYRFGRKPNYKKSETKKVETEKVGEVISKEQAERLYSISSGIDKAVIVDILSNYKFKSSKEITTDKYEAICEEIEGLKVKIG